MPKLHVAKVNDCISSIALEHGFFPDTIWNDADNDDLRRVRPDPNVLHTGDLVVIPDKRKQVIDKPVDERHRFKRRGFPCTIHIRLLKDDEPRANEPYQLVVDGKVNSGITDGGGYLWIDIPANSQRATLFVGEGEARDEYELAVRALEPVTESQGVYQRLHNLGYRWDSGNDQGEQPTRAALECFQKDHDLPITGENDAATQALLAELHGS